MGLFIFKIALLIMVFAHFCYADIDPPQPPLLRGELTLNSLLRGEQEEAKENTRYIRNVIYRGNTAINDSRLAELLNVNPGRVFDPKTINNALPGILEEYRKLGYFFARVEWKYEAIEKDQVIIKLDIDEGEIVKIGKIEFSGNSLFSSDKLLKILDNRKGDIFDDSIFQKDMERLLKLYSDNGHPLAKISPSDFNVEDDRLNFRINIDEGALLKIRQVRINGLKKTKATVVLRELDISPGDTFNQQKIDENQRKINNLGYFQDAQTSFSKADDDGVFVDFQIAEARTGQFIGVIGYNPSQDNLNEEKFTGMLEAVETNLLGTGRNLALRGKLGPVDTYELSYLEPWFLGSPVDVGIHLWGTSHETQVAEFDENITSKPYRERAASLRGTIRIIRLTEGSLGLTYKWIKSPVSTANSMDLTPISSGEIISGENYSLTLAIQRDSRDYFLNPSAGRVMHSAVEISRGAFKIVKGWLDFSQYFGTWERQVLYIGLHGARVWGETIPITEMMYLGGANTLRGYAEDFFRGEGRLFANFEYRFLVSRDSQFFAFIDSGTIYSRNDGLDTMKLGYGVGMRLRSQTGLISMDYGLARGDSILSGKIHVSLGAKI